MGVLDELTVESRFHAAVRELAEVVDPLPRPDRIPEWVRRWSAGDRGAGR